MKSVWLIAFGEAWLFRLCNPESVLLSEWTVFGQIETVGLITKDDLGGCD